jgi:hypothetical protein
LRFIDLDGPFGFASVTAAALLQIRQRLGDFETMTWREIGRARHCHFIEVERVCSAAQRRLSEIQQDDTEMLYQLGMGSVGRLWGIRFAHEYRILWWDPNHEVYPTEMRNT